MRLAYPILSSLGVCATVSAPTSFVSRETPLRWSGIEHWGATSTAEELAAMSWDQLAELAAQGWEIGSHPRTHPHLTRLDDATLRAELAESPEELADRLGTAGDTIAYPYGDADERVADAARAAGYLAGAATPVEPSASVCTGGRGSASTTMTRGGASG